MSAFADGAWNDRREGSDDAEPFEEQEPRDTVPMPVDSAGGFPIEGTEAAPTCSVCGIEIELDPTCDNSTGPLYCEPCHDKVHS